MRIPKISPCFFRIKKVDIFQPAMFVCRSVKKNAIFLICLAEWKMTLYHCHGMKKGIFEGTVIHLRRLEQHDSPTARWVSASRGLLLMVQKSCSQPPLDGAKNRKNNGIFDIYHINISRWTPDFFINSIRRNRTYQLRYTSWNAAFWKGHKANKNCVSLQRKHSCTLVISSVQHIFWEMKKNDTASVHFALKPFWDGFPLIKT